MNAKRITTFGIAAAIAVAGIVVGCSGESTTPVTRTEGSAQAKGQSVRSDDALKVAAYHSAVLRHIVRDSKKWLAARPKARTASAKAHYRQQLCDRAIESAMAYLPMLGPEFTNITADDRKELVAAFRADRSSCGPAKRNQALAFAGDLRMSIFTPVRQELVCDPLEEPTDAPNDCISDAINEPFDAVLAGLASLTSPSVIYTHPGTAFTDLTAGVLGAYGSTVTAADFAVLADLDGVAVSSESEWTSQIAPDLIQEIEESYDESSIFRVPTRFQSEDPCKELLTEGNDTKCSVKIIREGLKADFEGCIFGVGGKMVARSVFGRAVKRIAARSFCAIGASVASGDFAVGLYLEYA